MINSFLQPLHPALRPADNATANIMHGEKLIMKHKRKSVCRLAIYASLCDARAAYYIPRLLRRPCPPRGRRSTSKRCI